MSRPGLILSVLIPCILLASYWAWPFQGGAQGLKDPKAASITFANYERIQEGMTEADVNALLGVPPGDYRSRPGFHLVGPGHIPRDERARGGTLRVWYIPRFHVEVLYGRDGRVIATYWYDPDKKW